MQTTRLTLRTLLAFNDDIYDLEHRRQIERRIRKSDQANLLLHRIGDVMQQSRLGAPGLLVEFDEVDPNTAAEYLDHVLSEGQSADYEKICFESDLHLAEVAGCHQILSNVLGEPAQINRHCRQRLYDMQSQASPPAAAESHSTENEEESIPPSTNDEDAPCSEEPAVEIDLPTPSPPRSTRVGESLQAMRRRQRRWWVAAVVSSMALGVAFACFMLANHFFTLLDRLQENRLFVETSDHRPPSEAAPAPPYPGDSTFSPIEPNDNGEKGPSFGYAENSPNSQSNTSPTPSEHKKSPPAVETRNSRNPAPPIAIHDAPLSENHGSLYTKLPPPTPSPAADVEEMLGKKEASVPGESSGSTSAVPVPLITDEDTSQEVEKEERTLSPPPGDAGSSVAFEAHQRLETQSHLIDPEESTDRRPPEALAHFSPPTTVAGEKSSSPPTPSPFRAPTPRGTTGKDSPGTAEREPVSPETLPADVTPTQLSPETPPETRIRRSVPLGPPTLLKKPTRKPSLRSVPSSPKRKVPPRFRSLLPDLPGYAIPPEVGDELSAGDAEKNAPPAVPLSEGANRAELLSEDDAPLASDGEENAPRELPSEEEVIPLIQPANFQTPEQRPHGLPPKEIITEESLPSQSEPLRQAPPRHNHVNSTRPQSDSRETGIAIRFSSGLPLALQRNSPESEWQFTTKPITLEKNNELLIPSPGEAKLIFPGGIETTLAGDTHVQILPRDENGIHGLRVFHGHIGIQQTKPSMTDRQIRIVTDNARGRLGLPDPHSQCYVVAPDPAATPIATPMTEDLLLVSHVEGTNRGGGSGEVPSCLYAYPSKGQLVSWIPDRSTTTIRMKESARIPLVNPSQIEQTAVEATPAAFASHRDPRALQRLWPSLREVISQNGTTEEVLARWARHPSPEARFFAYRIWANLGNYRPALAALSQAEERELWRENTLMMREALRKNLHSRRKLKDQLGAFSETVAMELYRMWSIPLPANGGRWNDTDLTYLIPRLEHPDPTVRVTAMQTLQLGGMKEWTGDPVTHPQQWSTAVRRWRSLHEQHPDQPR